MKPSFLEGHACSQRTFCLPSEATIVYFLFFLARFFLMAS